MTNPYPARFIDLLACAEGPILDCGSGPRCWPGVISFDIAADSNLHVRGDVLHLPFRSDTFGVILSQAVAEHVTDPQRHVDEMVRVLRPAGTLCIEAAFMQPVHLAPNHFFNITPYGLAYLCRELETVAAGSIGSLAELCQSIGGEIGVKIKASRKADAACPGFDSVAPGVWLIGRKR